MYQNLKRSDHTLKGEIGEIIAKYSLGGAISTKQNTKYILRKFNLKPEQLEFLERNWNSFDLIDPKSSIIYEVKTKNYFYGNLKGVGNKEVISSNFVKLLDEAMALGFSFKSVSITLYSDWRYGIQVKEFKKKDFSICDKKNGWASWLLRKQEKNLGLRGTNGRIS